MKRDAIARATPLAEAESVASNWRHDANIIEWLEESNY